MNDQIICPHCKKEIPLTQALSHKMREQIEQEREQDKKNFEEERKKMRAIAEQWREAETKRLEQKFAQGEQELEAKLKEKIQKEMELKLLDTKNESEELKKEKQALQEQYLENNKRIRRLQTELEQKNLEVEKKVAEEEAKIKIETQRKVEEEYRLKMREQDKKLEDVMKANDELRRKLEQGSQQTQGEVLELVLEELLRREFPLDEISEVPKGKFGADLIQVVRSRSGERCGTIVWELKRTKIWSNDWIPKLKQDQRAIKAEIAVIISDILPNDIKLFGPKDGVYVGSFPSVVGMAVLLRKSLLDVSLVKNAAVGKKEKMEIMWEYLTSVEFKQKVEAIIEVFSAMQSDIEKEKMWFKKKWEKQESSIRRVIDNTAGMYGSLESIMGKALPEIASFEVDISVEEVPAKKVNGSVKVEEADSLF